MKDFGATIRNTYSTLLAGVTHATKAVPFYDEEPLVTTPDNYVVLVDMTSGATNNDQHFVSDVLVTLEVVTKANMKIDRSTVDSISNSVLEALLPSTYVDRGDADFQIMIISAVSAGYIREQDGSIQIIRKILRINNRINQK